MLDSVDDSTKKVFARKRKAVVFESNPFKHLLESKPLAASRSGSTLTSTLR